MESLFSVNQAAFILKVHPLTIRRYIKEKKLNAIKAGGNVRIRESELNGFHKDFTPNDNKKISIKKKTPVAKLFTEADPFLKLKGRAASVEL